MRPKMTFIKSYLIRDRAERTQESCEAWNYYQERKKYCEPIISTPKQEEANNLLLFSKTSKEKKKDFCYYHITLNNCSLYAHTISISKLYAHENAQLSRVQCET